VKDEEGIISNMTKVYNALYSDEKSESLRDIWREVYGDDYPEEVNHDSAITWTDLRKIVEYFKIGPGKTFIDVGCGRGGPGLWIARELGANYFGFDLSESAVEVAAKRAIEFGLIDKIDFRVGNIYKTNFPDNYFDGALSTDALSFIPDQLKALNEVARIIHSGALFIFTSFEKRNSSHGEDYGSLLRKTGFEVIIYEETPDWNRRQREVYQKVIESKRILIKDMEKEVASLWIMEAKGFLPKLNDIKRIMAVAKKK
jgi:ubiquinone/menaquinone biosynthesis C-methylase UbiE